MIVKSMRIENYRPYKGPVEVNFAEGEKNVTIIQGRNDAGKTSFINAVTWCLYDKEPFRDEGIENRCNQIALDQINVNERIKVKVEMIMEDSSGRDIKIIRQQLYTKISENSSKSAGNSELLIYRDDGINKERINNPEEYIKNNLPESLQEYFIFTGEKLTQFFNKDQDFVKTGVYTLYQLDLLENINLEMKKWEKYYNTKFKKINPKLSEYIKKRSEILEKQQADKIKIRENNDHIDTLEIEIKSLYGKIGASGADADEIQRDIRTLEDEKLSLKYNLKDTKNEYTSLIQKNITTVASYKFLKKLSKWSDVKEETNSDEITISVSELKKLLENKECICGAPLEKHTEPYKHVEDLIDKMSNTASSGEKIQDIISNLLERVYNIQSQYPNDIKMDILNKKQKIKEINRDIETKNIKIDGLNTRLKNLNIDYINDLKKQIDKKNEEIKKLTRENAKLEENLKKYPKKIEEINNLISQASGEEDEKDEYSDKMEFCEDIKLISKEIYDELAVNIYKTLSEVVTEEYKTIHWKADYKRIIVDQDFKVLIEKSRGNIVSATDPSTGSRNVLALTFMAALNSLSGFVLPQIIDTPVASLDKEMRSEVAKSLPGYMKGKQMILLVMNTEYTGEFKDNIQKFVGYEYNLDYIGSEGSGQTIINKLEE